MSADEQSGFSLIEVLSVVAITGMLLSSAVPMLAGYQDKQRLIAAAELIYGQMQIARSESILRSADIYVKFEINGADTWSFGTSMTSGCNPDDGLADANPCYLVIDDGDGETTIADRVLQTSSSNEYPGVSITNVTLGSDEAKFHYQRGTAKAGSIKLESANGYRMKVVTGLIGRIRLCSPSGSAHVGGYPDSSCSW